MIGEEVGDLARVGAVALDPDGQGFESLEHHPRIERAHRGPGVAHERHQMLGIELPGRQHRTTECTSLPVDMLRRGIDDDVGTMDQGPLKHGGGEDVVDDDLRTRLVGELAYGRDVDELERGVRRGLEEDGGSTRRKCGLPLREVGSVDKRRLDPPARQKLGDDEMTRAEQCARGDNALPGAQVAKEGREHGGHARRGREARLRTFEERQALLEHRNRRITVARIDEAVDLAHEARFGFLRTLIDEAGGEKDRLARLPMGGASSAAAHQIRLGAPVKGGRLF